jgi:hypothetical protein
MSSATPPGFWCQVQGQPLGTTPVDPGVVGVLDSRQHHPRRSPHARYERPPWPSGLRASRDGVRKCSFAANRGRYRTIAIETV